ncbi:MAG: hypothetical protein SH857_09970 [Chitinophagales bacterium]|nr:hypothetical protein [Chitinophagales bacterium]
MEIPASQIESLFERVESYSKTSYELSKLKTVEMFTLVITELVSRLSAIIMLSLFALVLNIGIALMLGEMLGKSYYGFFIVAAFYLVGGIVLHFFLHKWIKKPVSELIITHALQ